MIDYKVYSKKHWNFMTCINLQKLKKNAHTETHRIEYRYKNKYNPFSNFNLFY